MEDKKKRTANFNNNEKKILSELVMKYKDILECKRTDSSTNKEKNTGWERLAQEFHNISSDCYRTPNNLKTCWENIKRATKKQVSYRKKEMFMTGGGRPQQPIDNANVIVEAVLGPSLEGLTNIYDGDGPNYYESDQGGDTTQDNLIIPDEHEIILMSTVKDDKENCYPRSQDKPKPSTSNKAEELSNKDQELWENWTPKSLKRPVSEVLRPVNTGEEWCKRRRPRSECSSDALTKEKIELVKILKKNAEEEGDLRILILKEQLKQEQIKTAKLSD